MSFGATPLLEAVGRNDRAAIDALLSAGADINQKSDWWAGGFGVLDSCPPSLAPYLIERGAIVDAHAAARLGMIDTLRDLLDADPSIVHARGGDGRMPLHWASSIEAADLLLDRGADIDAEDIDHESTPAQHLASDHPAVAAHLVARGCRVDVLMAASLNLPSLLFRLLEANPSDIRKRVNDAWFPMRNRRAGGAIYRWTIGWNRTPQTTAYAKGNQELFAALMERTPSDLALCIACEIGDDARVAALLSSEPDLVQRLHPEEQQQLIAMAELGNGAAAVRMLNAGFPADVTDGRACTALHWAAFHGDAPLVRALMQAGANPDAVEDEHGATPAGWAEHGSMHSWFRARGDYAATLQALQTSHDQETTIS